MDTFVSKTVNPSFKYPQPQADRPGFHDTTSLQLQLQDALQPDYICRPLHFPPSPPPTNSDPKRSIPLPSFYSTADPGPSSVPLCYSGPSLGPPIPMKNWAIPFGAPISPPPTIPTPTQALPPNDTDYLTPIPEYHGSETDDDDLGSSLLGLPQPSASPCFPPTHSLLSPLLPEWETSRISSDMAEPSSIFTPRSILPHSRKDSSRRSRYFRRSGRSFVGGLDSHTEEPTSLSILGLSPYPSLESPTEPPAIFVSESALLHPLAGQDFAPGSPHLDSTSRLPPSPEPLGMSSYPSPAPSLSLQSPASSTDMDLEELSTPASHLLEDLDLAIESDLLNGHEGALGHPHSLFLDFDKNDVDINHNILTSRTSPPFPSLSYPYPLSPFHSTSPASHHIFLPEPAEPELHSFPSPKLSLGSSLSLGNFSYVDDEEEFHRIPLSPSSPSLRSSSLPRLELEEEEDDLLLHLSSSPSQPLLALPGADVDDTLLPALDWDMGDMADPSPSSPTASEASSSFGSLLLFDEEDSIPRSPSPEPDLTTLFDVDVSGYTCPRCSRDKQHVPRSPCQCTEELGGLTRLRRQYLNAEREARNVEGKMKAQVANARISGGKGYGYGWGVGKESEYGDRARYEARKRVKREKERGREVGDLVRLEMTKRGVCVSSRGEEGHGQGEDSEAQGKDDQEKEGKKKKKKPELKSVDQLVAKMLMRRKDNTAYRPLTCSRPTSSLRSSGEVHMSSPLVTSSVLLPAEDDDAEDHQMVKLEDGLEEMIIDAGDSPSLVEETLTPQTEGDDGVMLVGDEDHDTWLSFSTMDGDHTMGSMDEHHSSWWKNPSTMMNGDVALTSPPGLMFI